MPRASHFEVISTPGQPDRRNDRKVIKKETRDVRNKDRKAEC